MSGPGDSPYFGEYPPDFFDFIVIDECHRGGANDEGIWRAILDYFAPAVQLGLTATPKRTINMPTPTPILASRCMCTRSRKASTMAF
jgi:type I restriction enzyme R subunit